MAMVAGSLNKSTIIIIYVFYIICILDRSTKAICNAYGVVCDRKRWVSIVLFDHFNAVVIYLCKGPFPANRGADSIEIHCTALKSPHNYSDKTPVLLCCHPLAIVA